LGGNSNDGSNIVTTIIIIVSLRSLVNVAQKEERDNDKQRGINRVNKNFFVIGGLQEI
jgi:hypothetical protein